MSKSLLELLEGVLGKTSGELSSLIDEQGELKDDSIETLKAALSEKIETVRKAGIKEGHGRGMRETLSAKEKSIAELLGVEPDTIENMVESKLSKERDAIKANPEDITKSQIFIEAMKAQHEEKAKMKQEFQDSLLDISLEQYVPDVLTKNGFKIPEDEARREVFKNLLLAKVKEGDVSFKLENNKPVLLDKTGNPIATKENNYNPLTIDDRLIQLASVIYDKDTTPPRQSPDTRDDKVTPPTQYSFQKPSTKDEAVKHSMSIKDRVEREAYIAQIPVWEKEGQLS